MQGGSHGPGAGEELLHHAFDAVAETSLVEVDGKDVLAAVESAQTAPVLVLPADLQRRHDGLQLTEQRVGRRLEGLTTVVDALQVTGIAGKGQRDEHEVGQVQTTGEVLLDGLAKADGYLLRRVHGDALWRVGHERIGQTTVDDRANELIGIDDAGVGDHRHGLDVTDLLNERADVHVLHLRGDKGVAKQTAIDGHGRMEGVETRRDLHRLYLVDGLTRGVEHTS